MRRELLSQDVESTLHVLRPLVDDIKVGICLDETSRRGAHCRAHIGDVEATVGLCTDFVRDGAQQGTVALLELRAVGVGGIEVERRILGRVSLRDGEEICIDELTWVFSRESSPPPNRVFPSRDGPR